MYGKYVTAGRSRPYIYIYIYLYMFKCCSHFDSRCVITHHLPGSVYVPTVWGFGGRGKCVFRAVLAAAMSTYRYVY
jgi:hypothetical protein